MRSAMFVVSCLVCGLLLTSSAFAQTWSQSRQRPSLFEIIAVDATSEALWPFGQEDLAGDGASTFKSDEAAVDLRSLYASVRAQKLWLRAYVSAKGAPSADVLTLFFIDTDANAKTGGKAEATQLWPNVSSDPSPGGYERAIALRGDGTLAGLYTWEASSSEWAARTQADKLVTVEVNSARDPLRLLGDDHGYFQASLALDVAGLTETCAAKFFVRTWNLPDGTGAAGSSGAGGIGGSGGASGSGAAARNFGDHIDALAVACTPELNRYGDPKLLKSDVCTSDASCPGAGKCRDEICVFAYECSEDTACRAEQSCKGAVCVYVYDKTCSADGDCNGLVCDGARCATCADSGSRACAAGDVCSPNGSCLSPQASSNPGAAGKGAAAASGPRVRGGAFSCSAMPVTASSSAWQFWLLGASAMLLQRRRRRRYKQSSVLCALLVLSALPAQAEDVDTLRFAPHATSGGFLQTESSQTRYPIDPFSLGVWMWYAHRPLIVLDGNDKLVEKIVGAQVGMDVTASYAFANWFELGVHVPFAYLSGDDLSQAALGDLRVLPKFTFLRDDRAGFGLGLLTELRIPTHTQQFAGGARNIAGALRLLADHRFGLSGFRFGVDAGVLLREGTHYRNVTAASEIQAGLGLGYRIGGDGPVEIVFDLRSAIGLAQTDPEEVSLEAFGGVLADLTPEWKLHAALGLGLLEGFGVPTFRPLLGIRWEPSPRDPDHDGQGTSEKLLEKQREELDPNATAQPENPGAVENVDQVDDAERSQAIREGYDACPTLPEDYDGIEDDDGCPEGDSDGDGVLDYLDKCAHEDETINGFEDDDGCPDEGPAQIIIEGGKIQILETIRFRPNSSEIESSSYPVMDQIALALRKHRELERVEIGGYTDNTGPYEFNMQLSRARARSVRQYLLARGIAPDRLTAAGYGPQKPIGDNNTEEGRSKNRRVEFVAKQ
ncbi:MAG: hypothetical protein RL701_2045 [Pseudomonadota bacterium]